MKVDFDYVEGQSFWETNFQDKINAITNDFNNKIKNLPWINEYESLCDQFCRIQLAANSLKNKVILFFSYLGLILSALLIIPFYWAFKTHKKFKNNLNELNLEYEKINDELIQYKQSKFHDIDVISYFDDCYKLLNIKPCGPLSRKLITELQNSSLFDLSITNKYNPMSTSWSIWNDQVININVEWQEHDKYMKLYTGSITTTNANGDIVTYTAQYSHPYHEIINSRWQAYSFMTSCSDLEFDFKKISNFNFSKNKTESFENKYFDKKFKWDYNNSAQLRMIFTPHKQEIFVNEFIVNNKKVPDADKLHKKTSFLYNEFEAEFNYREILSIINNEFNNFMNENDLIDLSTFLQMINEYVNNFMFDTFNMYKHLLTTPIMYSENQKNLINAVLNDKEYLEYLPHYLINHFLHEPFIKYDTNCFNIVKSSEIIKHKGLNIYKSNIKSLSFIYAEKVTYVKGVPVGYIDCIEKNIHNTIYYCYLKQQTDLLPSFIKFITNQYKKSSKEIIENAKSQGVNLYHDGQFILATVPSKHKLDQLTVENYVYDLFNSLN